MLRSWLKDLLNHFRLFRGPLPQRRKRSRRLGLERLEDRLNPASTLTLSGTTLVITAAAGETLTLSASNGQITVADSVANGLTASGGAAGAPLNFGTGPATSLTSNDPGGLQNDTTNVTAIDITGAGTVKLGGSNVLDAGWGLLVDSSGGHAGTFDFAGFSQTVNALKNGTGSSGTITSTSGGSILTVANGGSYGGIIDGAGNLGLTVGGGTLTLTGVNTYTGATTITGGGVLQIGTANALSPSTSVTIAANSALDLHGFNTTVTGLSGSGSVTNSDSNLATLTVQGSSSFAGSISNGSATTGLTVAGSSTTLTLTGSHNTYSGTTTISTGDTLQVGATNATSPNSTVSISSNGTLNLNGISTAVGGLTGNGSVTDFSPATLTVQGSSTFGGSIRGSTALTVGGSSTTLTLTGTNNSYSGTTTINATDTLEIGAANTLSPSSAVNIAAGGTLDLHGFSTTLTGLSGSGTVTNNGSTPATLAIQGSSSSFAGSISDGTSTTGLTVLASLILTGTNNTYSGTTTISGPLQVGAANATSPNSTASINHGATFDLHGFSTAVGGLTNTGTLTNNGSNPATLTVQGSSSFGGSIRNGTSTTALTVGGSSTTLTITGGIGLNSYSGLTTINATDTLLVGTANTTSPNSTINIAATGTLDLHGSSNTDVPGLTGLGNVTNNGNTPATLAIQGSGSSFAGSISDGTSTTGLAVLAPLILTGTNNTYSGTTTISGPLQVGAANATSPNSTVFINNGSTFDLHGFSTTLTGLSGSGTVTNNGSSPAILTVQGSSSFAGLIRDGSSTTGLTVGGTSTTLTLTIGANRTYSRLTTINATDTLLVGSSDATSPNSTVNVAAGGTLDLHGSFTVVGGLTGTGTVTNNGGGLGTLAVQGTSSFAGSISDGTSPTALTVSSGILTLTGSANTYSGTTLVGGGVLQVGAPNATSPNSFVFPNANGALDLHGFSTTVGGLTGNGIGVVTNNGSGLATLTVQGSSSYGGSIRDGTSPIALTVAGSSTTLTLTEPNSTYSGPTTINATDTLRVGSSDATSPNSTVNVAAGGRLDLHGSFTIVGGLTGAGNVTNNGGSLGTLAVQGSSSFAGSISDGTSPTALFVLGNSSLFTLTGTNNTYSGTTTILSGTLQVGATNATSANSSVFVNPSAIFDLQGSSTTVAGLSGSGSVTNGASGTATLTVTGGGSFSGVIQDGANAQTALTVSGGTLALSGASTYTGNTSVTGGTLFVNGSLASNVTVGLDSNSTAILGGTGIITGTVTINTGSTLSPGNSPGILTTGSLTFGSGSNFNVEIDGTTSGSYGQDNVTGDLAISSSTNLNVTLGYAPQLGDSYTLLTTTGTVSGQFAQGDLLTVGNQLFRIIYNTNSVVLRAVATQTISFGPLSDHTYGEAPFTLSASATSGLPVSFSIVSGPATVSGGTLTITGAGAVTVEADQAGNDDYLAAPPVQESFTVNPATSVFDSLVSPTIVYGTATTTLSGHILANGLVPTGSVAITLNGVTLQAPIDPTTGNFAASFDTSTLPASYTPYPITYAYAASTDFTAATDTTHTLTVLGTTAVSVASSLNPSAFGQSVTVTATVNVTSLGSGTPTGTVDFLDTTTNTDLGSGILQLVGGLDQATLTSSALIPGNHAIEASYGGDNHFVGSTSPLFVQTVQPSLIVLNSGATSGALSASGSVRITVTGGVFVDSSSGTALTARGNVQISAAFGVNVVGGERGKGNAQVSNLSTGVASLSDPLAALPAPALSGSSQGAINLSGNASQTLSPGIYSQIIVSDNASLTLSPGIYVIAGGGITVSGNGRIIGSGVLIYNAGSNYSGGNGPVTYGGLTISGNGTVNLTAASSGTYAGIAYFQDRANTAADVFSENAQLQLNGGIFYAPAAGYLGASGNAQLLNVALVVNELLMSGKALDNS